MKKYLLVFALFPLFSNAQSLIGGSNIVKVNLSSLAFGAYTVTYERKILPHITASLGISDMPKRGVPFQNEIENLANSSVIEYNNCQVSNFTITPELRIYLIGAGHGIYLAPYGRYTSMNLYVPIDYQVVTPLKTYDEKASFSGPVKAMSGGLMIGTQFQILKKVVLDIWIVGAHYGSSNGDITATYTPVDPNNPNNPTEKKAIQDALNTIDPSPFKVSGTVSKTAPTADINVSGPWVGVRALGINVGIRF